MVGESGDAAVDLRDRKLRVVQPLDRGEQRRADPWRRRRHASTVASARSREADGNVPIPFQVTVCCLAWGGVAARYWPIGCQTVFSSRKPAIVHGLCSSAAPRTMRLTLSAASRSSSATCPSAPVTSSAFTSMWPARIGASSLLRPVRMLTTPPGTSEVATASASSIAASGCSSEATATTALPPTIAGTILETSPASAGSPGAITPTTPVGSGKEKLKYGPATGFEEPRTWASLSAQPEYQTTRSTAASTSFFPEQTAARS